MKVSAKWLAIVIILATGCVKKETIYIEKPDTCFMAVPMIDYYLHIDRNVPTAIVDSTFTFSNCTSSSDSLTYQWNFGDGTTSTDKSPKHSYAKRGAYAVTLVALKDNKPIDSITQNVKVILGQKNFSFSTTHDYPVDMMGTADDGFLILGKSDWATGYYVMKVDSLLKLVSKTDLPAQAVNLSSMKPTADGNYILAGSATGADQQFALTKINASGSVLWSKAYSGTNLVNTDAVQTNDSHIVTIGSETVTNQYGSQEPRVMIIKTTNDGNVVWEKRFANDERIYSGRDIIAEEDGYVFAANKRSSGPCYDCDSVQIMKIAKSDGAVMWKTAFAWGFLYNIWDVRLSKVDGEYKVANMNNSTVFSFDKDGNFVDRNVYGQAQSTQNFGETADDGMLVLIEEYGNGFSAKMVKTDKKGSELWRSQINGVQFVPGGYSCCSSSTPIKSLMLKGGGNIILAKRNDNDPVNSYRTKIALIEIDDNGWWK
ncbi:MAG: PKD domain-containing protein [Chitinophagaceae bacterium]|nr:PKD domain-containing protein [Chitinophagaceae bacterium]